MNISRFLPSRVLAAVAAAVLPAGLLALPPAIETSASSLSSTKGEMNSPASAETPQGRLPLGFEPNRGQTDPQAKFLVRGRGYHLFLTSDGAVLLLPAPHDEDVAPALDPSESKSENRKRKTGTKKSRPANPKSKIQNPKSHILRLWLLDSNPDPGISGVDPLPGRVNYFRGMDPARWQTQIPTYGRVRYENVYPGIDLVFCGNEGEVQFDFIVAPGADPRAIRLAVGTGQSAGENRKSKSEERESRTSAHAPKTLTQESANLSPESRVPSHESVLVDSKGDLVVALGSGEVRFRKPVIYQLGADGEREAVEGGFVLCAARGVAFEVAAYDRTRPLVIDPVLTHSTSLGGAGEDAARAIALDGDGNIYLAGSTASADFPTEGPVQSARAGGVDAFVTKLNPEGTTLVYSTYLGGADFDQALALAVDSAGSAYVAGLTRSTNFPTTSGALQTAFGGGACGTQACSDAFAAKLDSAGSTLAYSTYLGGTGNDSANGLAVDAGGNAYLVGTTESADFPTSSPLQAILAGSSDAFVAQLNASGSALTFSTFLGGGGADFGQAIALDTGGSAVVTGHTNSTDFPTVAPLQAVNAGATDAFVSKLNVVGTGFVFSTYLGGSGFDRAFALALGAADNIFLTGDTDSTDFPPMGAFQPALVGPSDAFVTKLEASGSSLLYSSYLGGVDAEQGLGIAVDGAAIASVTGWTRSDDFPVLQPVQAVFGGGLCGSSPCADAFVTRVDSGGTALASSTYLGGSHAEIGHAVRVDAAGNAYVAGSTASASFPATPGAFQFARAGSGPVSDAFVARIGLEDAPGVALAPQALTFADQPTGTTSDPQAVSLRNFGTQPLLVNSITATVDFAVTHDCPASLDPGGAGCTLNTTFAPVETGERAGEIAVAHNAAGSPALVTLTGTAITPTPAVTFSPSLLEFEQTTVGSTNGPLPLTLTNSGSADLTITEITASADFEQTNNCPINAALAPGGACEILVTFAPASSGDRQGTISVTSNATGSPHRATLSGAAIAVFSLTATEETVTIRRGTATATFTIGLTAPEDFTSSVTLSCSIPSPGTCGFEPASIAGGETSTLTVSNMNQTTSSTFSFSVLGSVSQQTATLSLQVLIEDFDLTSSPSFTTIAAGDAALFTLTMTPVNGFTGVLTFGCFNLPPESSCSFNPETVEITGTEAVTTEVSIQTTIRSGAPPPPGSPPWLWLVVAVALATLAAGAPRARRRVPRFATALVLALALTLSSCGTDFLPIRGTFAGTFQVGIQAVSGDAVRTIGVFLTVR